MIKLSTRVSHRSLVLIVYPGSCTEFLMDLAINFPIKSTAGPQTAVAHFAFGKALEPWIEENPKFNLIS